MSACRLALLLPAFLAAAAAQVPADGPVWRGPTGMGLSSAKGLPLTWGGKNDQNVRWKVPLPGQDGNAARDQNQSSPIVSGGRVFVTVSYWPGKQDASRFPEH